MSKLNTPVEIDTALAAAWHVADQAKARMLSAASTMRALYVEQVLKQRMSYGRRGAEYPSSATPHAAAEWFRTMDPARSLFDFSNYSGKVGEELARFDERVGLCIDAERQIGVLGALYTGWSRFFVVTSSTGHIHSSMYCHTCRPTTAFGWLPDLSGQSQADAIAGLFKLGGDRAAAALCSACFPDAPVVHVGGKITKSQAAKMAA